jgi:A/G-specific adenine glycosylase
LPLRQALVVEILLQRTRAAQVVPVYISMFKIYPSAAMFGAAGVCEISELIRPLGLRWRAALLAKLASEIGRRKGRLPRTQKQLENLPGVGPYVASAALSLNGYRRTIIIDSNIARVLCRIGGAPYHRDSRRTRWIRNLADILTPEENFRSLTSLFWTSR